MKLLNIIYFKYVTKPAPLHEGRQLPDQRQSDPETGEGSQEPEGRVRQSQDQTAHPSRRGDRSRQVKARRVDPELAEKDHQGQRTINTRNQA